MNVSQAYRDLLPADAASDLKARFQDFYAALAQKAEPMLRGPEHSSWKQVLDLEHDNLIGALELAVQEGNGNTALRLAASLWPYWDIRANWQEGLRLIEDALSQRQESDVELAARAMLGKGILMQNEIHGSGITFIKQAYDLAESASDLSTAARALSLFATLSAYAEQGLQQGGRQADEAIEIAKRSGDRSVLAEALQRRGELFRGQRRYDEAISVSEEALEIFRELGDLHGQKAALTQLSWIHNIISQRTEARRYIDEALEIARSIGDPLGLAAMLLQVCWMADPEPDVERAWYEEALELTRRHGNLTQVGNILIQIGWITYYRGEFNRARECFQECQNIYEGKDPLRHANAFSSVAWVDFAEGDREMAIRQSRVALATVRAADNKQWLAFQAVYHGELVTAFGDPEEGLEAARVAVELFEELKDYHSIPSARLAVARALWSRGDPEGAISQFEEASRIAGSRTQAVRIPGSNFQALVGIAGILTDKGQPHEAESKLRDAYALGLEMQTRAGSGAAVLEEMSLVKLAQEEAGIGARLLGTAAEIRLRIQTPVDPVRDANRYQQIVQRVEDALGSDAFEKEFSTGRTLTEQEAIELCWRR